MLCPISPDFADCKQLDAIENIDNILYMHNQIHEKQGVNLISELEKQVTNLLESYERMTKENQLLRQEQQSLASKNASLIEDNHHVKTCIESLITRLKSLEENQ